MTKAIYSVIVLLFLALLFSFASLVFRFADVATAREATKQVEIRANADVAIAQINADAAVDVAQINADAKRDTSMAYLAHRAFTALLWAAGLLWLVVVVVALNKWGVRRCE